MKKNIPVDKKLAIFSSILISVATIGFIFLNYYIEPKIDKLKADNYDYREKQMISFDFINRSNYYIEVSKILNDHYHIIKLLDSKNNYLLNIENDIFWMQKRAVGMAFNSAISSKQIDLKDSEALLKEIDLLKSKEELLDKYRYYDYKGVNGTKYLQKIIEKNTNNILRYKKVKNILWPIFLILQSAGMLLGVWAIVHRR